MEDFVRGEAGAYHLGGPGMSRDQDHTHNLSIIIIYILYTYHKTHLIMDAIPKRRPRVWGPQLFDISIRCAMLRPSGLRSWGAAISPAVPLRLLLSKTSAFWQRWGSTWQAGCPHMIIHDIHDAQGWLLLLLRISLRMFQKPPGCKTEGWLFTDCLTVVENDIV